MNVRKPQLSFHKHRRRYFTKFDRTFHWLGTDKAQAQKLYAQKMKEWAAWRERRKADSARRARASTPRIIDIAELFWRAKEAEATNPHTPAFYRWALKRFLHTYGVWPAEEVRAARLQAFKQDLLAGGFSRKTVNHEVGAIKTLLGWAMDMEYIPPVNLRGVKALSLPHPQPRGYTLAEMRAMRKAAPKYLRPWLALNWLTLARPSELPRMVDGAGDWVETGIFELHHAKTRFRRIVFSDRALRWLRRCEPRYTRTDSYSTAVRRHCGPGGPHPLRHGAAQHLHRHAQVPRETVDALLGHLPPRVSMTYQPVDWQALRAAAARLTL